MQVRITGNLEACSFQKHVMKLMGKWYRISGDIENQLRDVKIGQFVQLVAEGEQGQTFTVLSVQINPNDRPVQTVAPVQTNTAAFVPATMRPGPQERGTTQEQSIARSVALKAAVELATAKVFRVEYTGDIVDVAACFERYLMKGERVNVQLHGKPDAKKQKPEEIVRPATTPEQMQSDAELDAEYAARGN